VAGISAFATEEEAVRKANDTPYGLSAYFYSRDVGRIFRVSEAWSTGSSGSTPAWSRRGGAVRRREGVRDRPRGSKYGIDEWLETKYLCMGGME
jgi:succinate-semialdehyde dehydrogenase/glutarate-semialdehyde dehydrogenase